MACAGRLLLLLSLLPTSLAWRTKSVFLFHKVSAHAAAFTRRGGPYLLQLPGAPSPFSAGAHPHGSCLGS